MYDAAGRPLSVPLPDRTVVDYSYDARGLATQIVETAPGGGLIEPAEPAEPGPLSVCDSIVATITGTAGDDTLIGTPGDGVINGRGGNDIICGRGGLRLGDCLATRIRFETEIAKLRLKGWLSASGAGVLRGLSRSAFVVGVGLEAVRTVETFRTSGNRARAIRGAGVGEESAAGVVEGFVVLAEETADRARGAYIDAYSGRTHAPPRGPFCTPGERLTSRC